eukprot:Phypoly_transcript_19712.p1 GENE.Phypoly_transcript_19712~~Phypoly_transcript_19712.p1  ORF type:complete len:127 (+),score=10.29 Phypoly_transcript_19712:203-583(+)
MTSLNSTPKALVAMNELEAKDWLTCNFPMFLDTLDGLTGAQIFSLTEAQIANSFEEGKPRPKPAMISAFYNQLHVAPSNTISTNTAWPMIVKFLLGIFGFVYLGAFVCTIVAVYIPSISREVNVLR